MDSSVEVTWTAPLTFLSHSFSLTKILIGFLNVCLPLYSSNVGTDPEPKSEICELIADVRVTLLSFLGFARQELEKCRSFDYDSRLLKVTTSSKIFVRAIAQGLRLPLGI